MKTALPPLCLAGLLALTSAPALAQLREYTNDLGQKAKLELVSHTGIGSPKATFRTEGGKEMELDVGGFSRADEEFIQAWMEKTPPSVDYHFNIEVTKEKLEGKLKDYGYKKVRNNVHAYKINIMNRSRAEVSDLTVKYHIFYSNRAEGLYSSSSGAEKISGEAEIRKTMKLNHEVEFTSSEFALDTVDYDYGPRYKDSNTGIMLRIYDKHGRLAAEFNSEEVKNKPWPSEKVAKTNKGTRTKQQNGNTSETEAQTDGKITEGGPVVIK